MPRIYTEVPETWVTISRPVAVSIAHQVASILTLPKDTRIVIPGSTEEIPMAGSTQDDPAIQNYFKYDGRLLIEAQEDYHDHPGWVRPTLSQGNPIVFADYDLGLVLRTIYGSCKLTLDMTYRAPNRTLAERFRDEARMRSAMTRSENLHEVKYQYGFPPHYLELIREVHYLRESVAGYGEDLDDWVKRCIDDRATTVVNLAGKEPQIVIPETQVGLLGWFDFEQNPAPADKDNEGGAWNLKFQYILEYDRVMGMSAEYPLVIHNQLIGERFYHSTDVYGTQYAPHYRKKFTTAGRKAQSHFTPEVKNVPCYLGLKGVSIPVFDTWGPTHPTPDTLDLCNVMVQIDPDQPRLILDIAEMGEWQLDPVIYDFFLKEKSNVLRYGQSLFFIEVYENDRRVSQKELTIDQGVVSLTRDMQLRNRYHLRLAILGDLTALSESAIERLSESNEAGIRLLIHIQQRLVGKAKVPELEAGWYIPRYWIRNIGKEILEKKHGNEWPDAMAMPVYGQYTILTKRMSQFDTNHYRMTGQPRDVESNDPSDVNYNHPAELKQHSESKYASYDIQAPTSAPAYRTEPTPSGRRDTPDYEHPKPRCDG